MPETNVETFGEAVRVIRQGLSLSQADIANAASVSQSTVSRIENNDKRQTDPARFAAVLWALGVPAKAGYEMMKAYEIPTDLAAPTLTRMVELEGEAWAEERKAPQKRPIDLLINLGEYVATVDVKVSRFDRQPADPHTAAIREELVLSIAKSLRGERPDWFVALTAPVDTEVALTFIDPGSVKPEDQPPAGGGAPPIPGVTGRRLSGQDSTEQDPQRAGSGREPDSRRGGRR